MARPSNKIQVVYHGPNCADGFGAAYAVWKAVGKQARFLPVPANRPLPELNPEAPVYFLDMAPTRAVYEQTLATHPDVLLIDHHEGNQEALRGLPGVSVDASRSAAVLAWQHWHPGTPIPELLLLIEDQDLYRNQLAHSREVAAALAIEPKEFAVWDKLDVAELIRGGSVLVRQIDKLVDGMVRQRRYASINGWRVATTNATCHWTEVCHRLLDLEPTSPFAACYYDSGRGERRWSLRSRGDINVAEIAQAFGGGGHPSAAGFAERNPSPDFAPRAGR